MQCWLIIKCALWHLSMRNLTGSAHEFNFNMNRIFKVKPYTQTCIAVSVHRKYDILYCHKPPVFSIQPLDCHHASRTITRFIQLKGQSEGLINYIWKVYNKHIGFYQGVLINLFIWYITCRKKQPHIISYYENVKRVPKMTVNHRSEWKCTPTMSRIYWDYFYNENTFTHTQTEQMYNAF